MMDPIKINMEQGRFDFEVEFGETGPDGTVEFKMRPHPDRYDWLQDEEHGRVLYDRKTNTIIPAASFRQMIEQMEGLPMYAPPPDVPDAENLMVERKAAIEAALRGDDPAEELASPSAEALADRVGEKQEVGALSVDIAGSTRLQAGDPEAYGKLVPILLREIAAVTAVFGGIVINFAGDGAIIGFLGPGFNVANDMVFDAATVLVADVYKVLNPAAAAHGFPGIDIRVGLDVNEAEVTAVGSERSRRQHDVLGIAVSMAAKVQSRGAPGEVWVGQALYEGLHVSRQAMLSRAEVGGDWEFVNRYDQPYALYRFPMVPPLPAAHG
jgi:class 3 adenylate cyclase